MENKELIKKIILNGKVGQVPTDDDNDSTIGILNVNEVRGLSGNIVVVENGGFAFTRDMAEEFGFGTYLASVKFYTSSSKIDASKVEENLIRSIYGEIEAEYCHAYSDCTGYLWTTEDFKVGGHDIPNILYGHVDEFIHMEIEIYK